MPFPLRRLPFLASINVIKNVDVKDLINFIHMSTKMKNLVKISKVHVHLDVLADNSIGFRKLSDPDRTQRVQLFLKPSSMEKPRKNTPFVPVIRRKSKFICEENLEGYLRMMDDFVDIFVVISADFDLGPVSSDLSIQYLEYAMSHGIEFKKVQVDISYENSVNCDRKILEACTRASDLSIRSYGCLSEEYSVLDRFRQYKMDVFEWTIDKNFEWFTLDHLFALINCSHVRIYGANLSDADFNKFLKHWMIGIGNMETLYVGLDWTDDRMDNMIDGEIVMDGIPRKELRRGEKFEVERVDGVKATVCCLGLKFSIGDIDLEKLFG